MIVDQLVNVLFGQENVNVMMVMFSEKELVKHVEMEN